MSDLILSRRQLCVLGGAGLLQVKLVAGCGPATPDNLTATQFAAGSPTLIETNQATYFSDKHTYVCRDAKGYYALWDDCKHTHCFVKFRPASTDFLCPCHQSNYAFDGSRISGPTVLPLDHYALSYDLPTDNLVVDTATTVDAGVRLTI